MKKSMTRLMLLVAVFGMLLALLTYSHAQADGVADSQQQDSFCTSETTDIDTAVADESLLTSEVSAVEDAEPSACNHCTSNAQCIDGVCDKFIRCCIYF